MKRLIIISVIFILVTIIFIGCSEKTTNPPDNPPNLSPLINKYNEAWVFPEENNKTRALVFKENGILELYFFTSLFGWARENIVTYNTEENLLYIEPTPFDYEGYLTFTISEDSETLTLIGYHDEDESFVIFLTKKAADLENYLIYPDIYNKDLIVIINMGSIYAYIKEPGTITSATAQIGDDLLDLSVYQNGAIRYYTFTQNTEYLIELTVSTNDKVYTESATITTVQQANITTHPTEENWWNYPIPITWSFLENDTNNMYQLVEFGYHGDCPSIHLTGVVSPNERTFTIPAETIPETAHHAFFQLEQINYVLTIDAIFISSITDIMWYNKEYLSKKPF